MGSKLIIPKERGVSDSRLSDKQRAFVDAYLTVANCNAAEAARIAGYSAPNAGSKLVKHPLVSRAIGKAQLERSKRTQIEADIVLKEIASVALVNIQDFLEEDGKYIPPDKLPRHVAAAVYSVEWRNVKDADGIVIGREVSNYTFWDKMTSLNLLARHLGIADGKNIADTNDPATFLARLLAAKQASSSVVTSDSIKTLAQKT